MEITGLSGIVAGNASGLAGATARMLAAHGAHVTIFDLDADEGLKIAAEIGGHFVAVNIADDADVE
jgi:NADP-dependent 3-hydroxy acid dehydrogenase YdfG